ncbi:MAG: NADH-quinone oxidoreductase subunit A [Planctomycetota bacterium]|jgi:NADH-quinone oxidoreductase subunit A
MPESGGQSEYLFLLIHLLVILGFAAFVLILSHQLGRPKEEKDKNSPYECGIRPVGKPRHRYSMKFYIIALLFILFDIEIVFLFPWAINLRALGGLGFTEMFIFVGILGLGLVYAWRKGALEWE